MLRSSGTLYAAEFKQKSRWTSVWPNMRYGAMYLNYSVGRQLPMKGVNWVTRDCNRLTTYAARYSSVIADIDTKRNEEELNIQLSDIRWNDHRRIYWRCSFCGSSYRKNVSVRVKFHAGCNFCKGLYPSAVLGPQAVSTPLREAYPDLAQELADNEKKENLVGLSCTSSFRAEWKCTTCGENYRETIRSRTGRVEPGQAPLHPHIREWTSACPSCRWAKNNTDVAKRTIQTGQYLGLDMPVEVAAGQKRMPASTAPIRRRKPLVS